MSQEAITSPGIEEMEELTALSMMTAAGTAGDGGSFIRRRVNFIVGQIVIPSVATGSSSGSASVPPEDRFRILYLPQDSDSNTDEGFWINTSRGSNIPECFSLTELTEKVLSGEYRMATDLTSYPSESEISQASKKVRDHNYQAIRDIVAQEPAVYQRKGRGKLIQHAMDVSGLSYVSIYNSLGKYWRGGKDINALLPNYKACGTGRKADFVQTQKLGRKKKYEGTNGKILTPEDLQNFKFALDDYRSKKNGTLQGSYMRMLIHKYSTGDSESPEDRVQLPPDEKPSFRQFYYWYTKNRDKAEDARQKKGEHDTSLNRRAILGRTETGIAGPGLVAQIDATIGDFYLVRGAHREQIVGRPVLFFVMDVKTRMIMGMHITLENASWESALMALKNCADNKVDYCSQYGIEITQEQWPCTCMPGSIVADNGELGGKGVETVIRKLGITVENMPPYRGDLKGIIERNFGKLCMRFRDIVPGYVDKDEGIRGAENYRLHACLTIREFTQIVIRCVLFYNNIHLMKKFTRTVSMIDRGIDAVPLQLWNYGIRYETGALKTLSQDTILKVLLPRNKATVTPCGIRFNNIYYTCPEAEKELWYEKARADKSWKIEVAYDPTSARHIYIFAEDDRIITCNVLEKDLEFGELTEEELTKYNEINRQNIAAYSQKEEQGQADLERQIGKLVAQAKKEGETVSEIRRTLARCSVADSREQEKREMDGSAEYMKNQSKEDLQALARSRELRRHQLDRAGTTPSETVQKSSEQASGREASDLDNDREDNPIGKKIQEALKEMGML